MVMVRITSSSGWVVLAKSSTRATTFKIPLPLKEGRRLISPPTIPRSSSDAFDFVADLRSRMEALRPVAASRHAQPSFFVHRKLTTAAHVFLRDDSVRRSLQPPYSGPHRVISKCEKTLTLVVNGEERTVSVDPTFADGASSSPLAPAPVGDSPVSPSPPELLQELSPVVFTRSGRRVKFRDVLDL
ncbi:Gag-Pol polyprotein [Operophtera brumata]|uniref:Gag-Pol polyprotein n=1 Tax=Operophtera brumata TaxID=104452 RepID=A0A0L7LPS7_OPEBR|nr:Gag-Pol polyprotein [Operophtera brumata]